MTQELKACPFCGNKMFLIAPEQQGEPWFLTCPNYEKCPSPNAMFDSREEATKGCNTRPREDALAAENERLRKALEPFANLGVGSGPDDEPCSIPYRITRGFIRNARRALGETQ